MQVKANFLFHRTYIPFPPESLLPDSGCRMRIFLDSVPLNVRCLFSNLRCLICLSNRKRLCKSRRISGRLDSQKAWLLFSQLNHFFGHFSIFLAFRICNLGREYHSVIWSIRGICKLHQGINCSLTK